MSKTIDAAFEAWKTETIGKWTSGFNMTDLRAAWQAATLAERERVVGIVRQCKLVIPINGKQYWHNITCDEIIAAIEGEP